MANVKEKKKFVCSEVSTGTVGEGNHNKVWMYEIYDDGTALVSWGRVGKGMQSMDTSEYYCHSKINEKLKKGYREVQTLDCSDTDLAVSNTVSNSSLKSIAKKQIKSDCPQTQKLIEYLTDVNAHNIYQQSGGKIQLDVSSGLFKTPLGVVTKQSIDEARDLLVTLNDCVKSQSYKTKKMGEAVNSYLMLIPQEVGNKLTTETFLPDLSAIQKQNDLLDGLEASYATAISGVTTDKKASKTTDDAIPDLFKVTLTLLSENDAEYKRVKAKYHSTKQSMHTSRNLEVSKIYSVEITSSVEAFKEVSKRIGNVHEFFHGSKASNLLSILKSGFIIPPANASYCCGRAYGDGVYAAPCSTKALNYATTFWGGKDEGRYFMFIVNMAMGKIFTPSGGYYDSYPPKGYDSTWAKGGLSGVINDECIVYNVKQVNPLYLIEFEK